MLEKLFKLKENKTTVRTEVIAGLTTFMTMAYIIDLYCFRNRHVCDGICRQQAFCNGSRHGT